MKKLFVLAFTAILFTGCASLPQLPAKNPRTTGTSTASEITVANAMVSLTADLEVSPVKITYVYVPSKAVRNGGFDNIKNYAVREALDKNGSFDVLLAIEQQVEYNKDGECISITVSGYPARYKNIRSVENGTATMVVE